MIIVLEHFGVYTSLTVITFVIKLHRYITIRREPWKTNPRLLFPFNHLINTLPFFLLKMWTTNMCIKTSQIIIFWKKIYRYKEAIDGKRWCNQVSTDLSKLTIHLHKNRDSAKTYKIKDHTAAVCIKIFGFLPSAMQMLILDSTR